MPRYSRHCRYLSTVHWVQYCRSIKDVGMSSRLQNQNAGSIHLLENSEILPLVGRWYASRKNVSKTRFASTQLSGPAFLKDDPIPTNGPAPIESSIAMSWSCRPNNPRFVWPCFSTVSLIISTSPSTILSGRSLYDGFLLLCTSKTGLHVLAVFGYTFES